MKTPGRKRYIGVLFVTALWASAVRGQVGSDAAACRQRWGAPVSGEIGTNGYGKLQFRAKDIDVDIEFVSGKAQRVIYRSLSLDESTLNQLLGDNADDARWGVYVPPGRGAAHSRHQWMRVDEMAMAEFSNGALTVIGSGWYRHLAEPNPPADTNKVETAAVERSENRPDPNTAGGSDATGGTGSGPVGAVAGFWACAGGEGEVIVLHIKPDGETTYTLYGEYEKKEVDLATVPDAADDVSSFLVVKEVGKPTIATLQSVGSTTVRLVPRAAADAAGAILKPLFERGSVQMTKRPDLPDWRPKPRERMPAVGDSRERVVELLGPPLGTLKFGKSETLRYDWGQVVLQNGRVQEIE